MSPLWLCLLLTAPDPVVRGKELLGAVRFESGSENLTAESLRILDQAILKLRGDPDREIAIVGHTDRHGEGARNQALSLARARVVEKVLLKRGVSAARLRSVGLGFSQPLSDDDALNRRAEVWVGPPPPFAWVSFVHRLVEAQPPERPQWDRAYVDMNLLRLSRMRTAAQASGEVTFQRGNKLFLGGESYLVLAEKEALRNSKQRVTEVKLEEGSLMARLGQQLALKTPAAEITAERATHRVRHTPKKRATSISVYSGQTKVKAQNREVPVNTGFGTRVKEGLPPEPPTPLPPPPAWIGAPGVVFQGEPITLRISKSSSTADTWVEITTLGDRAGLQPRLAFQAEGTQITLPALDPGRYRVFLSTVDARELVGRPGPPRIFAVLPPLLVDGQPLLNSNTLTSTSIRFALSSTIARFEPLPGRRIRVVVDGLVDERTLTLAAPRTATVSVTKPPPPQPSPAAVPPTPLTPRLYLGTSVLVEAPTQGRWGPRLGVEAGFRFADASGPALDLGLEFSFARVGPESALSAPGFGLAAQLGWQLGVIRPFVGGGIGARLWLNPPDTLDTTQLFLSALAGLGTRWRNFELTVQGGYLFTSLNPQARDLHALTAGLGLKVTFDPQID